MKPNDNVNIDLTVRDGEMNRMAKLDNRSPKDVVNILNSVFRKQSSKQRIKLVDLTPKELEMDIKNSNHLLNQSFDSPTPCVVPNDY